MKKGLWIGFILCLMLTLFGCSKSDQEKMVGTWLCEMDMTELLTDMLDDELDEMDEYFEISSFTLDMEFTFMEEGKYRSVLTEESIQAAIDSLKNDLTSGVTKMMEDMLEGTGITLEQALEASGMTMDDMIDAMGIDALAEDLDFVSEGVYAAKKGKLYMSEGDAIDESEYTLYELEEDQMTFTDVVGTDLEELKEVFPLVLKRQK